jgi:hypothetical protein
MTAHAYVILAYSSGLGLLLAYAGYLWIATRSQARRDEQCGEKS